MKTVFLDRDGTLNIEIYPYLTHIDQLQVFDFTHEAIRLLNKHQFKTILVTNQSCVAKKLISENYLQKIHETLLSRLKAKDAHLDAIYYCPHNPEDKCFCRKPNGGMVHRAVKEHGVDLKKSYMVGDRLFDLHLGKNMGLKTVLVLTGAGEKTFKALIDYQEHPDHIADNVLEAVRWITQQS